MFPRLARTLLKPPQRRNFQQVRSLIRACDPNESERKGSAVLIEKSLLFDPQGNPLEMTDICLEFLKDMNTPFLIVSRERTTEQQEYENFKSKFKLSFEIEPYQFATIFSCMAESFFKHDDHPITIMGGHEDYFKTKGFTHIYTKNDSPSNSNHFIFTSLLESQVSENTDLLKQRLMNTSKPLYICAFQDGKDRLAKKMVRALEDDHIKITERRPVFSYLTTGNLAFHAKRVLEESLGRRFKETCYIGSVEHKSNLGSEILGVFVKDVAGLKSSISAFVTKTDLWE